MVITGLSMFPKPASHTGNTATNLNNWRHFSHMYSCLTYNLTNSERPKTRSSEHQCQRLDNQQAISYKSNSRLANHDCYTMTCAVRSREPATFTIFAVITNHQ